MANLEELRVIGDSSTGMATLDPQTYESSSSAMAAIEEPQATDTGNSSTDIAALQDSQTAGNSEAVLDNSRAAGNHTDKNKRKKQAAKQRKAPEIAKAQEEENLLNQMIAENRAKELEKKAELVPRWEIKHAPGKGKGMFATRDIPKGTEIFREAPMIIGGAASLSREAILLLLHKKKKKAYMALEGRCYCRDDPCRETEVQQIWENNSFAVKVNMKDGQTVLYENASRINHSCVANAIRTLTQEWHVIFWASKDIKNGEEITRNYGGAQGPAEHRQEKLKEDFSFVCVCEACIANDTLPCNRAEEDIEVVKMIEEKLKNGTPVTEIVKQRTPEQVEAEKTVKQWLLKIRLACNELAKQVTQSTIEACNQPGRDHKEAVQHALQNSRELWDKKIRDHSKIKHGDKCVKLEADVLSKYMMQFEYAFAEAMGKLTKAEEPLYMLAYFWRVVDGSLKYEFSGQKPPNDGRLWLHRPDAKLVIKGMEEKSAALKREASRNTPSSANDDHLADIPLAFPASKDEATLKGFTASNTAEPKGETTLKVSAPPDMATPTAKVVSKDSTNQDNLAAPKDSTDPNVAAPHDLAAPQDLANQDNLASPKDATAPNEAVPQDSASQGNFAAPKDGVVKDLAVSKDEVAPEGWTVPNMAAPKFEGTPKDEAVFKDLAASKDGVAPKGSTAPNMATPKGLAAPNVAAAKGEAAFKVLATPAMAAPKDSVALQDLADLFGLAS